MNIFIKKLTPYNIYKKIFSLLTGKVKLIRIGKINTTHYFWEQLVTSGNMPFIKIELLRDNPMNIDIDNFEQIIRQVSDYDVGLIKEHLLRMEGN